MRGLRGQVWGLCDVHMGSCPAVGLLSDLSVSSVFPSAQRWTWATRMCVCAFPPLGKQSSGAGL